MLLLRLKGYFLTTSQGVLPFQCVRFLSYFLHLNGFFIFFYWGLAVHNYSLCKKLLCSNLYPRLNHSNHITPLVFFLSLIFFVVKHFSSPMFRGVYSIWYLQFHSVCNKLLTLLKLPLLFCHIV